MRIQQHIHWISLALLLARPGPADAEEFHDPDQPLRIAMAAPPTIDLATSRRINQPGLRYALETSVTVDTGWSPIASYRGDGEDISLGVPGLTVAGSPIDSSYEALDFRRASRMSANVFYRIRYAWMDTIVSGDAGAWTTVSWSEGIPARQMNASIVDASDVTVTSAVAEAHHLFLGSSPPGSTLTIDGGALAVHGGMVIASSPEASGSVVVNAGSLVINAGDGAANRFEIGRFSSPVVEARGVAAAAFLGGVAALGDIRFNLNPFRHTRLEIQGSTATVHGESLWGNEAMPNWSPGSVAYVFDDRGIAPLALSGRLDLGSGNDHFGLTVDATAYAGPPGPFPLVTAAAITGDWAAIEVTGFPPDRTVYLSHQDGDATLTVDAPIGYYADDVDRTFVRLYSRDGGQVMRHAPDASTLDYALDAPRTDLRSHWYIQTSTDPGQYWIRNRVSGQAVAAQDPASGTNLSSVLIDFGTDGTYRGASVPRPDARGHHWNEVGYEAGAMPLVSTDDTASGMTIAVTTPGFGTDSYNGPAGPHPTDPTQAEFDGAAVGELGATNAVYDYFAGAGITLELTGLDPARTYTLNFFGSHRYNDDNVTRYTATGGGGAVLGSVDLAVGVGDAHNRDKLATLSDLTVDATRTLRVTFQGVNGTIGYLNAMQIETHLAGTRETPAESLLLVDFDAAQPGQRWVFHPRPGCFGVEGAGPSTGFWTVDGQSMGTVSHADPVAGDAGQSIVIEPVPRGAMTPWTSYDEDNLSAMGNGATILEPTYDRLLTHAEAQKRSAVLLEQESAFLGWTLTEAANAFVLRYAIEDSPAGGGLTGSVTLEIRNPEGVPLHGESIPVSSEQAWVYFDANMTESDDPSHGRPAKRFNEARIRLPSGLPPGSQVEFRRSPGEPLIWIDVLETEWIDAPLPAPAGFLSVVDFGAVADDGGDDLAAFSACIAAATGAGIGTYIPAGVFDLSSRLTVGNVTVQGAGMWHTTLSFTAKNGGVGTVGFWGAGDTIEIRDLYMTTPSTTRSGGGNAFRQYFGTGSSIAHVWVEHFTVGGWIGDYSPPYDVSDGLAFVNCRIRNTFADGINFARGTRNAVIDNCHFRSTGDDSAATWSSDDAVVDMCRDNTIRYNTIECTYRAAGVGVFGGEGHRIHHNLVRDIVSGAALRFNTTFASGGYDFSTNGTVAVYANSLYRSGTLSGFGAGDPYGAINLRTRYGEVRNISFSDILIDDVQHVGVWVDQHPGGDVFGSFSDITFDRIQMVRMPVGTRVNSNATGEMEYINVNVLLDPVRGTTVEENLSPSFTLIHSGNPPVTNTVIRL